MLEGGGGAKLIWPGRALLPLLTSFPCYAGTRRAHVYRSPFVRNIFFLWITRMARDLSQIDQCPAQQSNAQQRQNTEISKQIFLEKEYRGLSPNFHIHASVSDLYVPTIGLPILLEEICLCRPILGLYKLLTDTWMWKLGLRPRYSQKRNQKRDFRCSA